MDVNKCKSDEDLRAVLGQHWEKYEVNLSCMFYKIYWIEDLIKAIRKGAFTHSNIATYRTSEMGLSMLLLMPWTEEQQINIEQEFERRKTAGKTITIADLGRAERVPRMPPSRWEDIIILFTTWSNLMEILFMRKNDRFMGMDSLRRYMMGLADTKLCYNASHFVNILCAAHDDAVCHMNMTVSWEDLQNACPGKVLQFPTTRLRGITRTLAIQGAFRMQTLPVEWSAYIRRLSGQQLSYGGGGGNEGINDGRR